MHSYLTGRRHGTISSITRGLLCLQCIVIAAISYLLIHRLQYTYSVAIGLAIGCVIALRCTLIVTGFFMHYPKQSHLGVNATLGLRARLSMLIEECSMSLWSTMWTMPFCRIPTTVHTSPATLPVLLLHGYGCNAGFWYAMHTRLNTHAITHAAINIEPVFGSIEDTMTSVHCAIEELLHTSQQQQLIIVAHSMGGLVARAYLRQYGVHQIAKVITLGTPHHGTLLASAGLGKNCKEMLCTAHDGIMKESLWLSSLAASEDRTKRALFTSIYSIHDNIIAPQISSHLEGAKNIAVNGIGHMALCRHNRIGDTVIAEIHNTRTHT